MSEYSHMLKTCMKGQFVQYDVYEGCYSRFMKNPYSRHFNYDSRVILYCVETFFAGFQVLMYA